MKSFHSIEIQYTNWHSFLTCVVVHKMLNDVMASLYSDAKNMILPFFGKGVVNCLHIKKDIL